MKLLILAVLVVCISLTESSASKKICQKDSKFLLSVVRVCNLYRRSTLVRQRNWSSLQRYVKYALKIWAPKKQRRSYEDEDEDPAGVVNDVDSSSFEDFGNFDDENGLDERAADEEDSESDPPSDTAAEIRRLGSYLDLHGSSRHQRATKLKKQLPPPSKDPFRRLKLVCSYLARLLFLR